MRGSAPGKRHAQYQPWMARLRHPYPIGKYGYRGIRKISGRAKPFVAECRKNGRRFYKGYFRTEIEAARAYDDLARKHHGRDAILNFPELGGGTAATSCASNADIQGGRLPPVPPASRTSLGVTP